VQVKGNEISFYTKSVGVCADGKEPSILHVLSCLSITMKCSCRVGACSVGCGWPGSVFGSVVPYFLACGGGSVSHWSVTYSKRLKSEKQ